MHTLEAPQAFRTWLYRIARDKTVDALRRLRRERSLLTELADEQRVPEDLDVPESTLDCDDVEQIHRGLNELTATHREVLTLRFLEDMPLQEIADVVGCSLGTVKSRLHHARRLLREKLETVPHG